SVLRSRRHRAALALRLRALRGDLLVPPLPHGVRAVQAGGQRPGRVGVASEGGRAGVSGRAAPAATRSFPVALRPAAAVPSPAPASPCRARAANATRSPSRRSPG